MRRKCSSHVVSLDSVTPPELGLQRQTSRVEQVLQTRISYDGEDVLSAGGSGEHLATGSDDVVDCVLDRGGLYLLVPGDFRTHRPAVDGRGEHVVLRVGGPHHG